MRALLNSFAIAALEGRIVEPKEACCRTVAAPLPLHAKSLLDELPRIEGPEEFARRLKPLLGRTASVSRPKRLGLLVACIAPTFLFAGSMIFSLFMHQRWIDRHPDMAPLYHCVKQIEKLEHATGPADDAQEQQRRALEVYVAARFADTISDPAVWSASYAEDFLTENQRKIAQRAVAAHLGPSAREIAEATGRLQPFLHEPPEGLPGLPVRASDKLVFALAWALVYLLIFAGVPSAICALLFRGGLLMYVFGISLVTKDGSRASRLRIFSRSLIIWSPCVPLPMLAALLKMNGLAVPWSFYLLLVLLIGLVAWSVSLPERGIPDRLARTYPVPR